VKVKRCRPLVKPGYWKPKFPHIWSCHVSMFSVNNTIKFVGWIMLSQEVWKQRWYVLICDVHAVALEPHALVFDITSVCTLEWWTVYKNLCYRLIRTLNTFEPIVKRQSHEFAVFFWLLHLNTRHPRSQTGEVLRREGKLLGLLA
jgi:hypothetical protein